MSSGFSEKDLEKKGFVKRPDGSWGPKPKELSAQIREKVVEIKESNTHEPKPINYGESVKVPRSIEAILSKTTISGSFVFPIDPVSKPRMTQQDKWKTDPFHKDPKRRQRPAVTKYFNYKRTINILADGVKFKVPESGFHLIFYMPMPQSWSKKKKEEMNNKPHQQRPDKDNLEKAFLDALCEEDSYIWDSRVTKVWSYNGKIEVHSL